MQQEKRKTWVVSRQGSGFSKEYGGRVDLILNSFKKLRAVDGKAWNCCWWNCFWFAEMFLLTLCAVKSCSL